MAMTTQSRTVQAILNWFETSQVRGDYGQVTLLAGDTGHLTFGRSQTTLGSGGLHTLIARYCASSGARFGARLTAREQYDDARHRNNWQHFGRLKAGATLEQAQSQLDAINAANLERFPQWREILKNARFSSEAVDFHANLIGERRSTLTMLWGGEAATTPRSAPC